MFNGILKFLIMVGILASVQSRGNKNHDFNISCFFAKYYKCDIEAVKMTASTIDEFKIPVRPNSKKRKLYYKMLDSNVYCGVVQEELSCDECYISDAYSCWLLIHSQGDTIIAFFKFPISTRINDVDSISLLQLLYSFKMIDIRDNNGELLATIDFIFDARFSKNGFVANISDMKKWPTAKSDLDIMYNVNRFFEFFFKGRGNPRMILDFNDLYLFSQSIDSCYRIYLSD